MISLVPRLPVDSSNLAAADCHEDMEMRFGQFKSGRTGMYDIVPEGCAFLLMESGSKERYFNDWIKDRCESQRIVE
ncbi:MAG: KTSC domain-containing protein [Chloroflexi bacterium]|nr:KTSC domain-containing protein [Chloroflexota bacterium]